MHLLSARPNALALIGLLARLPMPRLTRAIFVSETSAMCVAITIGMPSPTHWPTMRCSLLELRRQVFEESHAHPKAD